jgi:hypothetical protein
VSHHGLPVFAPVIENEEPVTVSDTGITSEAIAELDGRMVIVAVYTPFGRFATLPGTSVRFAGVEDVFVEVDSQLTPGEP